MASTITKVIDPDNGGGTDYTSLDAWEDALGGTTDGDLVTNDEIALAQCRASGGTDDTTSVNISGWTTDATRYIKVELHSDETNTGIWNANNYTIAITHAKCIEISEDYVRIDGIQTQSTQTDADNNATGIWVWAAGASNEIWVSNCIIKGVCSGTKTGWGILANDSDTILKIWNCVIDGFYISADTGFSGIYALACTSVDIWNCTIHNCTIGVNRGAGTCTVVNSLIFKCDNDFNGTITMTYCASDDDHTGDSVTNFVITQTADDYAALVIDATGGDFRVTDGSSELVGTGTDDPGGATQDNVDIAGTARSSTWDIGAFEYGVVVGAAGIMTTNTGYWGPTF